MRRLTPGSILWLMRHELGLSLRALRLNGRLIAILVTVLVVVCALGGGPLALVLAHRHLAITVGLSIGVDVGSAILLSLMLSQALSLSVQAFYERGDLDLLLSSPLPPRRVLFVRCLVICLSASGLYFVLGTPFLVPVALWGHWRVLGAYGLLAALGLIATGAALLLTTALLSTLGPRRTRTVGQVLAALVGASVFLLSQIPQYLPHHGPVLGEWLHAAVQRGSFGPGRILSWPAAAALGEPLPLLGSLALAVLIFMASVEIASVRFVSYAATAVGANFRTARSRSVRPFRTDTRRALFGKELRLIARDPALLSRVLLQVIYFIPMTFLVLRHASAHSRVPILTGVALMTLMAGLITGSLAWITISAEDAPDLLRCAPVPRATVQQAKLAAALAPVAILALPVLALGAFHPWAAAAGLGSMAAAALSNGLIQLWYEKPAQRKAFQRRTQGSLVTALGGLFVSMGWAAVAAAGAYFRGWSGFVALAVAVIPSGVLGLMWLGRNREERPAYRRQLADLPAARSS